MKGPIRAYETSPGDAQVSISRDGCRLLTFISTTANALPCSVISTSTPLCSKESTTLVSKQDLIESRAFIVKVTSSPSNKRVLVASVYQNYCDGSDVNNSLPDGVNFREEPIDVTLTIYCMDKCFKRWSVVSQKTLLDVDLSRDLFNIEWSKFERRYVVVTYPSCEFKYYVEVLDSMSASIATVASTDDVTVFGKSLVLYSLRGRYYIALSGISCSECSGVIVLAVDMCKSRVCVRSVFNMPVNSRGLDVKFARDNKSVLIANNSNQAIVPYYQDRSECCSSGLQKQTYCSKDKSCIQLLSFNGKELCLLDNATLNVPSGYAVGFDRDSDLLYTSTLYPWNSFTQLIVFKVRNEKKLKLVDANKALPCNAKLSQSCSGLLVASGTYSSDLGLGVNNVQIYKTKECVAH